MFVPKKKISLILPNNGNDYRTEILSMWKKVGNKSRIIFYIYRYSPLSVIIQNKKNDLGRQTGLYFPPPPGGTAILPEYVHYYGYYYQVIVQC
jgi:hypothetical protein